MEKEFNREVKHIELCITIIINGKSARHILSFRNSTQEENDKICWRNKKNHLQKKSHENHNQHNLLNQVFQIKNKTKIH